MLKQTSARRIAKQFRDAADAAARLTPTLQQSKPADGFFSWTVVEDIGAPPDLPHLGAVGVCDDQARAMDELSDALRDSPAEACGLLHKVALNPLAGGYCYDDLITVARIDPDSGAVLVSEHEPRGRWAPPGDVFAEIARAAGTEPSGSGAGAT